jgi:hypothetical protein
VYQKQKIPKNQRANLDTQGLPLVCVFKNNPKRKSQKTSAPI